MRRGRRDGDSDDEEAGVDAGEARGRGGGCSEARPAAARARKRGGGHGERRRQPGGARCFFSRVVGRPGEQVLLFIGEEL